MGQAAAGLRMELRRAEIAGVTVTTSPHIPQQIGSLYLPPNHLGPGQQAMAVVSDLLDAAGQWMALAIALAHHRWGHHQEPDPEAWGRQQRKAMGLALETRIPLEQLVRLDARKLTTAQLADSLGVTEQAVVWRVENMEYWEAELVALGRAG